MRCPSCGGVTDSSDRGPQTGSPLGMMDCCSECGLKLINNLDSRARTTHKATTKISLPTQQPEKRPSTLIEFPGVTRSYVPEWRKELSERVSEGQERRA